MHTQELGAAVERVSSIKFIGVHIPIALGNTCSDGGGVASEGFQLDELSGALMPALNHYYFLLSSKEPLMRCDNLAVYQSIRG